MKQKFNGKWVGMGHPVPPYVPFFDCVSKVTIENVSNSAKLISRLNEYINNAKTIFKEKI